MAACFVPPCYHHLPPHQSCRPSQHAGGPHESRASHHPHRRRNSGCACSRRAVSHPCQSVSSRHRGRSIRSAWPQSTTRQSQPLADQRHPRRRKSFHRRRSQIQFFAFPHGQILQRRRRADPPHSFQVPQRHRHHHRESVSDSSTHFFRPIALPFAERLCR